MANAAPRSCSRPSRAGRPWTSTSTATANTVHHFDLLEVHESLAVTVRSEVWTTAAYVAEEPTLSPLDRWDFLAPTRYVDLDDQVIEVAAATGCPPTRSRQPGS
jgi:hypothetical protein